MPSLFGLYKYLSLSPLFSLSMSDLRFCFETNKFDADNYLSYYFHNPQDILLLTDPQDTRRFFKRIEKLAGKYYLAGFFSYESGYLFEDVFSAKKKTAFPYALFGVYDKCAVYNHKSKSFISGKFTTLPARQDYEIKNLKLNTTKKEYQNAIIKIKDYIRSGDIYQVNYTMKYKFDFTGSPVGLYNDLKQKQNVAYNVFGSWDDYFILSLSPEIFFVKDRYNFKVKPMKGTFRRGQNVDEDKKNKLFLETDAKNRSENIMIVDLMRNDLSRISEFGTVKVSELFKVSDFNTLFQMTSTVVSRLRKNLSIYEMIKGIFPSGSVTGAPKIRSMEIISELEKEERKIYTGSIGFFQPGGVAKFNVAIRTVLIRGGCGEMGVGGGIVFDSNWKDEFEECKLKASFFV